MALESTTFIHFTKAGRILITAQGQSLHFGTFFLFALDLTASAALHHPAKFIKIVKTTLLKKLVVISY